MQLVSPIVSKDTRAVGNPHAASSHAIFDGVLDIVAFPVGTGSGTMTVRACGAAPSPSDARVTYGPGRHSTLRVVSADSLCTYSTTPIDVRVVRSGFVSADVQPARSQYVPLAQPVTLFDGEVTSLASPLALGRPAALPAHATAAVVALELYGTGTGHLAVAACGPAHLGPSVAFASDIPFAVDLPQISAGSTLCLDGFVPSGTGGDVEAVLLGYMATTGPDPASLPPMYTVRDAPSLEAGLAAFNPDRALDTRNGIGCIVWDWECYSYVERVDANETVEVYFGDYLSSWTTALSINVTITSPDQHGFLTVWPCDEPMPDASNLNFARGETRANLVVAKFSDLGTVCMRSTATTHLIADVSGVYDFAYGSAGTGVAPVRLLDTRNAIGVAARGQLGAGRVLTLQVAGAKGLPHDIDAITMNVTVANPRGEGFITVWPCDEPMPDASNVNYVAGRDVPNLVTVGLSAAGTVCMYTFATADLIADAAVWYGDGGSTGLVELSPDRILDTRRGIGAPKRKVERNQDLVLQVTGRGGVRADAKVVVMNMTITNTEGHGFLTVWPCDQSMPDASNLNFRPGDDVPNLVAVTLSAAGTVCMRANARTDILADVAGFMTATQTTVPTIVLA